MKLKLWVKITLFCIFIGVVFLLWRTFFIEKRELIIQRPIAVELIIDGLHSNTVTDANTVQDFLEEKNLAVSSLDFIEPDLEDNLRPCSIINIITNRKVFVEVDGETKEFNTIRKTIEKLLEDEKIKLNPFDVVEPDIKELTSDDLEVDITRIEKKNVIEEEEIEYETIIKEDEDLTFKKQVLEQEGKNGLKEVEYQYVYKDGELVSKTKLSTEIVREAQPEIITEGRKIKIESTQKGLASWYAYKGGMYCASVRYPKGTWLRVTSKDNGKQIIVQVNDYGPDPGTGKVIDLDKVAFAKLMSLGAGVISVKIEEIKSD